VKVHSRVWLIIHQGKKTNTFKTQAMLHRPGHAFTEKLDTKTIFRYLRIPLYLLETAQVSPWQIMKKFVEVVDNCNARFIQVVDNMYQWAFYTV